MGTNKPLTTLRETWS
jgi:hypothetical protein